MAFTVFQTRVNALGRTKGKFVRATFLYQQALKCQKCNPNMAMFLICSSADAMQLMGSQRSHQNFNRFFLQYTPVHLRQPPIERYLNLNPPLTRTPASFQEALDYIYSKLRCLYVHEGIERLSIPPYGVNLIGDDLFDKFNNNYYIINRLAILGWISSITKECLLAII